MSDLNGRFEDESLPIIDVHSHAMPLPFIKDLERRGLANASKASAGVVTIDPEVSGLAPRAEIPFPSHQYDVESRVNTMDAMGVHGQMVSAPPFLFASESEDSRFVLDLIRNLNDAVAEFVQGSSGRMIGLATLPLGFPEAADELTRCVNELGMVGATIGTFGGGRELDDPVNEGLWEALASLKCLVLLHPSRVSDRNRLSRYHLVQLFGYPVETGLAVARLIFGGVLERHELHLCLSHGGGCLPSVVSRLDLGWRRKAAARVIERPPSEYVEELLFDTAVFDKLTLRRLVNDVGPANVLLGTDFPFDLADAEAVASVQALDLCDADETLILGGNAMRYCQDHFNAPTRRQYYPRKVADHG